VAPEKTVERLCLYRRLLKTALTEGETNIFSHELAELVSGSAAQVRRDLMEVGVTGHSKRGYEVDHLLTEIDKVLDAPHGTRIVLIGVGDLGRAMLRFMKGYHERIKVVGAFDNDEAKIERVVHGFRCKSVTDLEAVIASSGVDVAIISTPADAAQAICDRLVAAGVRGIVNFAPVPLHVPGNVKLERVDIATALEKVACLVRQATVGCNVPEEAND